MGGDGFRKPGFSKERRLEPQITIGLLTDAGGFPLLVQAFEGNTAETHTMLPVIHAFMTAHQLSDVTIVADAGMISESPCTHRLDFGEGLINRRVAGGTDFGAGNPGNLGQIRVLNFEHKAVLAPFGPAPGDCGPARSARQYVKGRDV